MNHHKRHRINTEEYQRELQELFAQKPMLMKSLRALTAEHEELQKVIFRNGTHYPESTDRVGTPHPELQHLVVHKARNGKHVWSYHPELSRIHDRNLLQLMGGQKIAGRNNVALPNRLSSLQKPTASAVKNFAADLLNNPDRHAMSANTDPTKPSHHAEMRVRHLINALTGSEGYEIKDHPEGFEVYAPRHSKSSKAEDVATRWIYNAAKKDLRSERIYPTGPDGGGYGTKFGKSIRPRPSSNLGRRQADAGKSAAQRPRSSQDAVGKTKATSKLLKAEDEAGMTAYPLKDGYSLHHETSSNGYDIWSIGHNGQRAGSFMICTDETRRGRPFVSWAGVDKPHRGKGIGAAVYKTLAVHYGGLDSDRGSTSVDAIKAWRRAGGRQLKSKTQFGNYRYTLDGDKKRPPIVWNEDLEKAAHPNELRKLKNKTAPSKPNQWRVTHFVKGQPSGHTEAASFSDAIKKAHSYGYNVSKELSEEDMFKSDENDPKNYGQHNSIVYLDPFLLKPASFDERNGSLTDLNLSGKSPVEWAQTVNLTTPVQASMFNDGETHVTDGHHRQLAAQILHKQIPVQLKLINVRGSTLNKKLKDHADSMATANKEERLANLSNEIRASKQNPDQLTLLTHTLETAMKKSEDLSRVSSIVVATDSKMLMLQRRDNGKWTFPGGHLNDTESHLEGAVRELWEEAGIRANPDEMILLGSKKTFQNKDIHVYLYKVNSEVKPSAANDPDKEAQKFAWLPHVLPEDIKENLYIPVGDNSSLSMFSVWLLRQKTNTLKKIIKPKKSV